ncbi:hypothetical protein BC937DRAFT_94310 [Endogone sp. FLAS-F59071]|nr:hypothetical protein BC937DRAFT_94310 [Endogone sp. FLAS-F59071]|eukprot:RUS22964.1 hypothetical protein BC937DRAFT_94310 [Endogone sp. FLAS-F59071]
MDTLRSIDSTAVAITQETVKNLTVGPVKASLPPDRLPFTKKEELVFSWQEQLAWVQQQVKDLEITFAHTPTSLSPPDDPSSSSSEEEAIAMYERRVDALKRELAIMSDKNLTKGKIVESMDAAHVVLEMLHGENLGGGKYDTQGIERDSELVKAIVTRDEHVSEFLLTSDSLRKVKAELTTVQKSIIARHKKNRALMSEITANDYPSVKGKEGERNDEERDMMQRLEETKARTEITRSDTRKRHIMGRRSTVDGGHAAAGRLNGLMGYVI